MDSSKQITSVPWSFQLGVSSPTAESSQFHCGRRENTFLPSLLRCPSWLPCAWGGVCVCVWLFSVGLKEKTLPWVSRLLWGALELGAGLCTRAPILIPLPRELNPHFAVLTHPPHRTDSPRTHSVHKDTTSVSPCCVRKGF